MLQKKIIEKIKTDSMFNDFFFENQAVYTIMWKNCVEPGRPQMMCISFA